MIELAIIFSLATVAVTFSYFAFRLNDQHAALKMIFASVALFFLIGTTFTGYMFAVNGVSSGDIYQKFYNQTSFANGYLSTQSSTVAETEAGLGNLFIATHVERDLPAGESVYYIYEVGNDEPAQTRFDLTSTGLIDIMLYENGTRIGGTQGVIVENAKRTSNNTRDTLIYNTTDPADIGEKGVLIENIVSSSGSSIGQNSAGAVSKGGKWIFKSNTTYILEVENLETSDVYVGFASDFFELPAVEVAG